MDNGGKRGEVRGIVCVWREKEGGREREREVPP